MRCCLFCHRESRKKVRTQKGRTFIDYDQAEDGLCCANCRKFSCRGCLASIYNDIVKPSGARVERDDWVRNVCKFLNGEANHQQFVGTCCFFGKSQGEEFERANPKQCLSVPTYDGWMHFPEYDLLVGDSRSATDVVAVGPMGDIGGGSAWRRFAPKCHSVRRKRNSPLWCVGTFAAKDAGNDPFRQTD